MSKARTRGTLEHFRSTRWTEINRRVKRQNSYSRKGIEVRMSKNDFFEFCEKNKKIILHYYKVGETPSLDRIDNNGHYEIKNLQIISWSENSSKERNLYNKPVKAINLNTNEERVYRGFWTKEFIGDGFDPSTAQKVCKKKPKYNQHKGWVFEYTEKN